MILKKLIRIYTNYISRIKNKNYEDDIRARLINDNFSIICPNCIGGIIYHRLGTNFWSPTVNLFIHQQEYLKFIHNLSYYLSLELEFIKTDRGFPVALLGDVHIYFLHYKSEEDAKAAWDRRKRRMNYDNLYIILYERDGISMDDILSLQDIDCKGRIVLSHIAHPEIDYCYQLIPDKNHKNNAEFMDKDEYGLRTFEKQWDYVSWLNNRS